MNVFIEIAMRARLSQDKSEGTAGVNALKEIASEILDALEKYVGSSTFIGAYGDIQTRIRATKLARKRALASEAVSNPRAFAQRKALHSERKKQAKKRKNAQFATMRGKKRQRIRN
jgi:U3 small nucleolar RNA-associated protein 20